MTAKKTDSRDHKTTRTALGFMEPASLGHLEELWEKAFLDEALDLVKVDPWPVPTQGDKEQARKELSSLVNRYVIELIERESSRVTEVAEELEHLQKCSRALYKALGALSPWARHVLDIQDPKCIEKFWELADGANLGPDMINESNLIREKSSSFDPERMRPGLWFERTRGLAMLAGYKASLLRKMAMNNKIGSKTLADILRGGPHPEWEVLESGLEQWNVGSRPQIKTSKDWLIRECGAWLDAHFLRMEKRASLARLIHQHVNGKCSSGQFRQAASRTSKRARN